MYTGLKLQPLSKAMGFDGAGRFQASLLGWALGIQSFLNPGATLTIPTGSGAGSGQSPMRTPCPSLHYKKILKETHISKYDLPSLGAHFPELLQILIYSCLLRCVISFSSLTCPKQNSCFMFPPHPHPSVTLLLFSILENGTTLHLVAQSKNRNHA